MNRIRLIIYILLQSAALQAQESFHYTDSIARILFKTHRYDSALVHTNKALSIACEKFGEKDTNVMHCYYRLYLIYDALSGAREAVHCADRYIKLSKELNYSNPQRETDINRALGFIYLDGLGDYKNAEAHFSESVRLYKKYHLDSLAVPSLVGIAFINQKLGNFAEAENTYLEAKSTFEQYFGKNNGYYTRILHNLGYLYYIQRKYDEAESYLRESMNRRKAKGTNNNPLYAESINLLGLLYLSKGQYSEAEPLFHESVSIRKNLYGEKNYL